MLPPRSPKLNGCVERANRTYRHEFWECYTGECELPDLQAAAAQWVRVYNEVRPHQALGYLTPAEYLVSQQAPKV